MFSIEVELLTGRYVATAHDDRAKAEWPPHPARFFSALVAAHYEGPLPLDPAERAALVWLEEQQPPSLDVALEVGSRDVLDVFVPVNDITLVGDLESGLRAAQADLAALDPGPQQKKLARQVEKERARVVKILAEQSEIDLQPSHSDLKKAGALLPTSRTRQVRTFPSVVPERSSFSFAWPQQPPAELELPLARLVERVTRLDIRLRWCLAGYSIESTRRRSSPTTRASGRCEPSDPVNWIGSIASFSDIRVSRVEVCRPGRSATERQSPKPRPRFLRVNSQTNGSSLSALLAADRFHRAQPT